MRPPLHALHVFCVVVSQGGIRQAAHTLHLTPGAVSRQVRSLEDHLGQTLFDRGAGNAAVVTPAGHRLHERVSDKIAAVVDVLSGSGRPNRRETILIDTGVTFAMHWLIPQLRYFRDRKPNLHVHVRTVEGDIDPVAPVDVFIRREESELRTLPSRRFMIERSLLLASPEYVESISSADSVLTRIPRTRIGARSRPDLWSKWAKYKGLDPDLLEPTIEFDNTILAIQACVQGLGVMVVPELFVTGMLDSGTLRLYYSGSVETGSYSFAVGRQGESARVRVLTEWLEVIGARANDDAVNACR